MWHPLLQYSETVLCVYWPEWSILRKVCLHCWFFVGQFWFLFILETIWILESAHSLIFVTWAYHYFCFLLYVKGGSVLGREEHRDLIFPVIGTKPYVYTESATPGSEFSYGQQCLIEFPVGARRRWVVTPGGRNHLEELFQGTHDRRLHRSLAKLEWY